MFRPLGNLRGALLHQGVAAFGIDGHHDVLGPILLIGLFKGRLPLSGLHHALGVGDAGTHLQDHRGVKGLGEFIGQLCEVQRLGRGFAWLDTGTVDALAEASDFIGSIEKRQGFKVAALEEIAFRKKWIDVARLKELALPMQGNDYGRYLLNLAENGVE